jgi:hypothetical protein
MTCATMWAVTSPDYRPTPELQAALREYEDTRAGYERHLAARAALREVVAKELRTQPVTARGIVEYVPWTYETVRTIAREADVPREREPTVEARKKRRRPPKS